MTSEIAKTEAERRALRRVGCWGLFWTGVLVVALWCAPLAGQAGSF